MHRFILSLLLLTFISPISSFATTRTVVTQSPYYYNPNFNHIQTRRPYGYNRPHAPRQYYNPCHNCSNFSDINALEKYTMNRNFTRESDIQRLERLEMQAFGALQNGDINTRYENVRSAILSRPKQNYRTSLLRNIGDYFAGQTTGYTPSIGSSNPFINSFSQGNYPTNYGNTSFTEFSGPFGTRGYNINNYSTGSNAGIRILD